MGMGLDMYLMMKNEGGNIELHYWRKHPDLHGFIERLWRKRRTHDDKKVFNCVDFYLTAEDCDKIIQAVKENRLPHTEGFFFGKSEISNARKKEDIETFKNAKFLIGQGKKVYYSSWW